MRERGGTGRGAKEVGGGGKWREGWELRGEGGGAKQGDASVLDALHSRAIHSFQSRPPHFQRTPFFLVLLLSGERCLVNVFVFFGGKPRLIETAIGLALTSRRLLWLR